VTGWFEEQQTADMRLQLRYTRILHRQRSRYQDVAILETAQFGRMLALDNVIMCTEADEFVYHEMLVHPALCACPRPRRVLIVGGGDGGAAREVLRHPQVEEVVVAELDEEVVAACREHLPFTAAAFDDPRLRLRFGDGAGFVAQAEDGAFDAVVVDAPDPVGHALPLFQPAFHAACRRVLAPHGVLVVQSDSPFVMPAVTRAIRTSLRSLFPVVRTCWAVVPSYAGALWTFTVATEAADPALPPGAPRASALAACRYWRRELHVASFALPAFVDRLLGAGEGAGAAGHAGAGGGAASS
jgi:spermidine synthase